MTKLYKNGDQMGISTDAVDESQFMGQITTLLAEMVEAKTYEGDWEFQLGYWLPNIVDICCKMRGYKVDVLEKRWICAGSYSPDQDAEGVASINNKNEVKINREPNSALTEAV
jgi:hypothetical protein